MTVCTSSVEALELFRSKPKDFDLVITDMTMPKMTGDVAGHGTDENTDPMSQSFCVLAIAIKYLEKFQQYLASRLSHTNLF